MVIICIDTLILQRLLLKATVPSIAELEDMLSNLEGYIEGGVKTLKALLPLDFREPSGSSTELRWGLGNQALRRLGCTSRQRWSGSGRGINGYREERAILQLGREERCGVDKFLDSGDLFTV
jgi:hypothetical protein